LMVLLLVNSVAAINELVGRRRGSTNQCGVGGTQTERRARHTVRER